MPSIGSFTAEATESTEAEEGTEGMPRGGGPHAGEPLLLNFNLQPQPADRRYRRTAIRYPLLATRYSLLSFSRKERKERRGSDWSPRMTRIRLPSWPAPSGRVSMACPAVATFAGTSGPLRLRRSWVAQPFSQQHPSLRYPWNPCQPRLKGRTPLPMGPIVCSVPMTYAFHERNFCEVGVVFAPQLIVEVDQEVGVKEQHYRVSFRAACSLREVSSSSAVTAVLPLPNSDSRSARAAPIVSAGSSQVARRTTSVKDSRVERLARLRIL